MKTLKEIEDEIVELRKELQQNNLISLFEKQNCDSDSNLNKCEFCNCYKNKMEIYDVLESEKRTAN